MIFLLAHILTNALEPDRVSFVTTFDTNVHVYVSTTCPRLKDTTPLIQYANETTRQEALTLHNAFVEKMSAPIEELWEEEADERTLVYDLHLVHDSPHLLEFYGHKYQYTGGVHGRTLYVSKAFLQNSNGIQELTIDSLLLPEGRDFLFQYCRNYFKENRCGYYDDDRLSWDPLEPNHIDSFLLIKEGLLLIFQNYTVSGLEDEPITLLIPYAKIASLAKPNGLLSFCIETFSANASEEAH